MLVTLVLGTIIVIRMLPICLLQLKIMLLPWESDRLLINRLSQIRTDRRWHEVWHQALFLCEANDDARHYQIQHTSSQNPNYFCANVPTAPPSHENDKDKDDSNANQHHESWPKQPNQNDGIYVAFSSRGVMFHATKRSPGFFNQRKCFYFEGCHVFELSSSCYLFSASS